MCSHGRNRHIFANFATEISIVQIHLGLISKFKEERKKKEEGVGGGKTSKKSDRTVEAFHDERMAIRVGNAAVSSPNWTRSSRASRMSRASPGRHYRVTYLLRLSSRISQRAAFSRLIQYSPRASPPPRLSSRYERRKENPLESPSHILE